MTANWAATVVNVLIAGFFILALFGIGIGVYAARALKKAEMRNAEKPWNEEKPSLES